MMTKSLQRWCAILALATPWFAGPAAAAEVKVMISAGFFHVYSELAPAFEKATGHHLVTTRGPSMGDSPEAIPTRLSRGEPTGNLEAFRHLADPEALQAAEGDGAPPT